MKIEFESTPEYQNKYAHFYSAINILLQDYTAKINIQSVAKLAGYSRSAIRKDRDEWKPLLKDIESANDYQLQNPHFFAKATIEKSKVINANAKEYKDKYLNILSAFYDLSRIVEDQCKTIKYHESQIAEKNKMIENLLQEIGSIKSNGKITPISSAKKNIKK